jgi:hypothetical protein
MLVRRKPGPTGGRKEVLQKVTEITKIKAEFRKLLMVDVRLDRFLVKAYATKTRPDRRTQRGFTEGHRDHEGRVQKPGSRFSL